MKKFIGTYLLLLFFAGCLIFGAAGMSLADSRSREALFGVTEKQIKLTADENDCELKIADEVIFSFPLAP